MTAKSNTPPSAPPPKRTRTRTATVSYPYHALSLCIDVAQAVREIGNGKQEVSRALLASHLKVAETSGDFAQKIASSKTYGLIDGRGAFKLTDISIPYFFPTENPEMEQRLALLKAAAKPGAFAGLLQRYDGSKPPTHELMGNVLTQQMGIPESWKGRIATFFIRSMETARALGPDGFLRHAAALETAQQSVGEPPLGDHDDQTLEGVGENKRESKVAERELERDDVVIWKYPFGGRLLRVETPAEIPRDVWEKLSSYIGILEPQK